MRPTSTGSSHAVFTRFAPFDGWAEPGFERSFYGVNVRDWLFAGQSKGYLDRRPVHIGHPSVDEEYFEWIALLTAVSEARGRFCIAEIGAGWGRWLVSAAVLCRQRRIPFHLVGVEAEPSHFEWMKMVLRDNDIDPDSHQLWPVAAVDQDRDGVMLTGPDPPETVWGHRTIRPDELPAWKDLPGYQIRFVPGYSLARILAKCDYVDLDVQGTECEILMPSFETLGAKVGIVHVGTHPPRIVEKRLTQAFQANGWLNAFSYPCHSEAKTPFGRVKFVDGVQTWVNPARLDLLRVLRDSHHSVSEAGRSRRLVRWFPHLLQRRGR